MRNGFTLLELMVAVVLLSAFCAIALPFCSWTRSHSRTAACGNNLAQLWKMCHNYRAQYG